MAHQCPVCLKQFKTNAALIGHTGTGDPTFRKRYQCSECDQGFCSKRAVEAHRGSVAHRATSTRVAHVAASTHVAQTAPSTQTAVSTHTATFTRPSNPTVTCEKCSRSFASQKAFSDHLKSSTKHKTIDGKAKKAALSAGKKSMNDHLQEPSVSKGSHARAKSSDFVVDALYDSDVSDDYEDDDSPINRMGFSRYGQDYDEYDMSDEDLDYGLCDKDCAWCGHCADGVDL